MMKTETTPARKYLAAANSFDRGILMSRAGRPVSGKSFMKAARYAPSAITKRACVKAPGSLAMKTTAWNKPAATSKVGPMAYGTGTIQTDNCGEMKHIPMEKKTAT